MEIQKILWAYDGSKESEEALGYAVFIAKKFGSAIMGTHVIPEPEKLLYESEFRDWTVKVEERIKSQLSSIANELTSQELNFQGLVLKGEPDKEIVEFANREKVNLIVMGKRGQGLIDRMLTGSTTLRVLRESSVPVLTVKKREKKVSLDIRKILVPIDISEDSDSALNYAIDLAIKLKASISVLYVLSLHIYDYEIPYSVLDDSINASSIEISTRVEEIKLKRQAADDEVAKLEINTEAIHGLSTAISIVDYASKNDADLIVINTHGRRGVKRLILGSVTEKVIQEAHCAVLALKP
jgi:nucleotide-binding universal stress UspA family protein